MLEKSNTLILPSTPPKNPIIAAVLSALIPGLGQVYLKQVLKGLAIVGGNVVMVIASMGLANIFIWVAAVIDAYKIGNKLQKGTPVQKWEFF